MNVCNNSMLDREALNNNFITDTVDTLAFMDSSLDDDLPNLNGYDLGHNKPPMKVHTPSPMVARAFFNDHKDSRKIITVYSLQNPVLNDEIENIDAKIEDSGFNFPIYNKLPLTNNWINYQQNYSPELKRDTDIIFEEKNCNENDGELLNSDYSGESPSPDHSVSSHDSSSSNGSGDSDAEETILSTEEQPLPEVTHYNTTSSDHNPNFQDIFNEMSRQELNGVLYHQPPKALDRDAARRLARRLFDCDGFKITDIAKHLSKRNDFSQVVGEEFANFFDFTSMRLDTALRVFLGQLTLTGETQERERIMHHFSQRFVMCNNGLYHSEDACHTLVCALIILNTNLHCQNPVNMPCDDFIANLKELNEGDNFPVDNLRELYSAIEHEPIRWPMDEELVGIVNVPKQELLDFSRQMMKPSFPIGQDLPRDSNCRDFMNGYVVRKWLKEPGGRKASFGKRGWKLFYGRLRDLSLYLYKDHDKSVSRALEKPRGNKIKKALKSKSNKKSDKKIPDNNIEPVTGQAVILTSKDDTAAEVETNTTDTQIDSNSKEVPESKDGSSSRKTSPDLVLPPADTLIHINHALASRATDYVKKKNVFRIRTRYGSEYLFQVNNEKEMEAWVDNINYVAALLSDPEPTIGVSTMEKLNARNIQVPRTTPLNVRDQLDSHQKCVLELEKVVLSLKQSTPTRPDRRLRSELEESIRFREDELQRYKCYCQLLEYELLRTQNVANIRLPLGGSSDASPTFFCAPPQMTGTNPMPNVFMHQPLLNQAPANDSFHSNTQSNLRYRAPLQPHVLSSLPMQSNRRVRPRGPGSSLQSLSLAGAECTTTTTPDLTSVSKGFCVPPNPSDTGTFYDIV